MQQRDLLIHKAEKCAEYAETHDMPKSPLEWERAVMEIAKTIPFELGTGRFTARIEGEGDDARLVKEEVVKRHNPYSKAQLADVKKMLKAAFAYKNRRPRDV